MMKRVASVVLPLLLLVSCGTLPAPMSSAAFEAHIAYLADDALEGRDPGTPGCEAAEAYIVSAFEYAGLDAIEEQEFEFVAGARLEGKPALSVKGYAIASDDFVPLAYSSAGKGEAPAVFVGYGIEAADLGHDDYRGVDVEGRVVVFLTGSTDAHPHGPFAQHAGARAKALTALQKKARGVIVLVTGDSSGEERLPRFRGEHVSRDVGIPVIAARASALVPRLGIDIKSSRGVLARHESASRDLDANVGFEVRVSLERRKTRNVLGWLEAKAPDRVDELVIVGGHHDHLGRGGIGSLAPDKKGEIHNGADDNASGVAGVIELARTLAPRAKELRRHVLFMTFGAEERGLLGSKYFKEHPILRLPRSIRGQEVAVKPIAMVNLDMVGRLQENKVVVSGMATSPDWPTLLEGVRESGGHTLEVKGESKHELTGSSDHSVFYVMGMPVLFFFDGGHSDYHKPSDDLYRVGEDGEPECLINLEGMVRLIRLVSDVTETVANSKEPPAYQEGVKLTQSMRFNVVLRLMPDYGADVEGMRVANVTPGGPADLAGIQGGDVIVQFGDTPVRSVNDYLVGLQKAAPGKKGRVIVRRGDEEKVLDVLPKGMPKHPH